MPIGQDACKVGGGGGGGGLEWNGEWGEGIFLHSYLLSLVLYSGYLKIYTYACRGSEFMP